MRRKKRRGLSFGSAVAILLTGAVLAGCFIFFSRIAGEDMDAQAVLRILTQSIEKPERRAPDGEAHGADRTNGTSPTPQPQAQATPTPAPTPRVVEIQAVGTIAAPKNVRQSVYAS